MDGELFTTEILSDILESITAQNISKTNGSYNYNTNHKLSLDF